MPLQPHMVCYAGNLNLIWNFVVSDFGIFMAYFLLSVIIGVIAQRRTVPFRILWWGFASFIFLCGMTHLIHVIAVFDAHVFWIEAFINDLTAIVSVAVAIVALNYLPEFFAFVRSKQQDKVALESRYLDIESLVNINGELQRQNTSRIVSSEQGAQHG